MSSRSSRILLAAFALGALLVPNDLAAASSSDDSHLVLVARTALADAPSNFAKLRGSQKSSDDNMAIYTPANQLAKLCPHCDVRDEYAYNKADERWVVRFRWRLATAMSSAQTLAYAQRLFEPLVAKYTRLEGAEEDDLWSDWVDKKDHTFVYVITENTSKQSGFLVRIGHFAQKNVHFEKFGMPLSSAQRTDLSHAMRNFLQLGLNGINDNFASIRGKSFGKSGDLFDANVTFGDYLRSCDITDIPQSEGITGKWILSCETPGLVGEKSDVEAGIRSAIENALPYGYTSTTDPKYVTTDDYRWDRSSDSSAVTIGSYEMGSGRYSYHISIYHFTP